MNNNCTMLNEEERDAAREMCRLQASPPAITSTSQPHRHAISSTGHPHRHAITSTSQPHRHAITSTGQPRRHAITIIQIKSSAQVKRLQAPLISVRMLNATVKNMSDQARAERKWASSASSASTARRTSGRTGLSGRDETDSVLRLLSSISIDEATFNAAPMPDGQSKPLKVPVLSVSMLH
jgi:hypothetical protein